jgi:hypothetical protein
MKANFANIYDIGLSIFCYPCCWPEIWCCFVFGYIQFLSPNRIRSFVNEAHPSLLKEVQLFTLPDAIGQIMFLWIEASITIDLSNLNSIIIFVKCIISFYLFLFFWNSGNRKKITNDNEQHMLSISLWHIRPFGFAKPCGIITFSYCSGCFICFW